MVEALRTYTLGFKWRETGSKQPSTGTEIKNDVLAAALLEKVEFKKEEWEQFQVVNLSSENYIKAGNCYFKPSGTDVNYTDENDKTPLIIASECGHLDIVKKLLEKCANVNCKDANGKTVIDLTASRFKESLWDAIQNTLREKEGLTSDELFRNNNITGGDYNTIVEAVKQSLEEAPQSKRMFGDLKDLCTGEFQDTVNGLKEFLKVRKDWAPAKECAELEEEVRRLRDCPQ